LIDSCSSFLQERIRGLDLIPRRNAQGGGIAARVGVLRKWEACLRPEASDSAIMRATTEPPWLVTPEKVHAIVGRLIEMAHPKQIILFGSYARGKITEDSDLDVLIVAGDEVENTRRESVRLRGALKEIEMPIDIVVVRESTFQKLSDTPGLIYEEARRTGLLVYECES
jgi:predicted nucleotidyltransferase